MQFASLSRVAFRARGAGGPRGGGAGEKEEGAGQKGRGEEAGGEGCSRQEVQARRHQRQRKDVHPDDAGAPSQAGAHY